MEEKKIRRLPVLDQESTSWGLFRSVTWPRAPTERKLAGRSVGARPPADRATR